MTPQQQWWYTHELQRKTRALEVDLERVDLLRARPGMDRAALNRLKLERDTIMIRLTKLRRGLLY